jgi:hypothetical protein
MRRSLSDVKVIAKERNNETIIKPKEKIVHELSAFEEIIWREMLLFRVGRSLLQPLHIV